MSKNKGELDSGAVRSYYEMRRKEVKTKLNRKYVTLKDETLVVEGVEKDGIKISVRRFPRTGEDVFLVIPVGQDVETVVVFDPFEDKKPLKKDLTLDKVHNVAFFKRK